MHVRGKLSVQPKWDRCRNWSTDAKTTDQTSGQRCPTKGWAFQQFLSVSLFTQFAFIKNDEARGSIHEMPLCSTVLISQKQKPQDPNGHNRSPRRFIKRAFPADLPQSVRFFSSIARGQVSSTNRPLFLKGSYRVS
jgi:hypothetical protein